MLTVLLVLQVIITVSMVIVILIQRNASDGMAGLAGGGNSIMSGRASANLLTNITSVLAAAFIVNSLVMAAITSRSASSDKSIVDEIKIDQKKPAAPLTGAPDNASTQTAPATTAAPAEKAPAKNKDEKDDGNEDVPAKADTKKPAVNDNKETKPVVPIAE